MAAFSNVLDYSALACRIRIMRSWLRVLDRLLRGESTNLAALRGGKFDVPIGALMTAIIVLGIVAGMGMGSYALLRPGVCSLPQFLASTVKVPALFLLTLVVTFPSLYVFNALIGSRLSLLSILRLIVAAIAITLTVLASFAPIVAFFAASTTSYHFMVLLNVVLCAVAGFLGLGFLLQTLHRLTLAGEVPPPPPSAMGTTPPIIPESRVSGALEPTGQAPARQVRAMFRCWIVLFALVGSQMGWVLRPFIGSPDIPFTFFRGRESNFFQAVWQHFVALFQ
jgi:hypothetical protein